MLTVLGIAHGVANAGDLFDPKTAPTDPTHCKAFGEGFFPVAGSNGCIKIRGYVAAGAALAMPSTPFGAGMKAATQSHTGVSLDTRFDTQMGPARLYVRVGHDSLDR